MTANVTSRALKLMVRDLLLLVAVLALPSARTITPISRRANRRSAQRLAVEQRSQCLMKLELLAGETCGFARGARGLDLRGAERLELEQRRPRIARRSEERRVGKERWTRRSWADAEVR